MTIATEIEKKSKGISNNSLRLMHLHRSISQCKYRLNRRAKRLKKIKKSDVTRYRWQKHFCLLPIFTMDRKPYLPNRT